MIAPSMTACVCGTSDFANSISNLKENPSKATECFERKKTDTERLRNLHIELLEHK